MSAWSDVDNWRGRTSAQMGVDQVAKRQAGKAATGVTRHLSIEAEPYSVVLKSKETRRMHPEHLSCLGAATRAKVVLHALCGDLQARVPGERQHRLTAMRDGLDCVRCLVLLDEQLELGRVIISAQGRVERVLARVVEAGR